jgi:hypothetical protein
MLALSMKWPGWFREFTFADQEQTVPFDFPFSGDYREELHRALALSREGGRLYEHVYLNTGTWRKRYHECRDGSGFIGWKDMSYLLFYAPEEKPNQHGLPVFESWSGSLKREE